MCEKYWKTMSEFVNLYLNSAIKLYEDAMLNSFENADAEALLNHAKWNHQMSVDTAVTIEENFKLMKKRILEHDKQLIGDPDFEAGGSSIWSSLLSRQKQVVAVGLEGNQAEVKQAETENIVRGGDIWEMEEGDEGITGVEEASLAKALYATMQHRKE